MLIICRSEQTDKKKSYRNFNFISTHSQYSITILPPCYRIPPLPLVGKNVAELVAGAIVMVSIMLKKDDAMEDIFGSAAACMPPHSPTSDCLSGFPFSVHPRLQVALLTL